MCIRDRYIPVPVYCARVLQKSQKFWVRVWGSYRTYARFGYGYGSVTELTEIAGIVARAYRTHKSSGRVQKMLYPYPGYCGTARTELTEVPGTSMNVQQNSQKLRVRYESLTELPEVQGIVAPAHRSYRSSGYAVSYTHLTLPTTPYV